MKNLYHYIIYMKKYNITKYIPEQIRFFKEIIRDKYSSYGFKKFLEKLLLNLNYTNI